MKRQSRKCRATMALALALWALGFPSAVAKSVPAMLSLKGKNAEPGFVIKATNRGIEFATSSSATSGNTYSYDLIENLDITVPNDWAEAEKLFNAGEYGKARPIYTRLRTDYFDLIPLKGEFAGIAAFREVECYRHMERWDEMRERGNALRLEYFEPSYQGKIRMFPLWYTFAEVSKAPDGSVRVLEALVEPFRNKKESIDVMAQAAFLSGYVYEQQGDPEEALHDYHRACTLNFGRDRGLAVKAMERALAIYASEDPEELRENRDRLREAHGLGAIYKKLKVGPIDRTIVGFTEPIVYEEEIPEEEGEEASKTPKPDDSMAVYAFRDFSIRYPKGWESDLRAPLGEVGFAGPTMGLYLQRDPTADDPEQWMESAIVVVDRKFGMANMGDLVESNVNGLESARVSFDCQLPASNGKWARHVTLAAYVTKKGVYAVWVAAPRPPSDEDRKTVDAILGSATFSD